MRCSIRFKYRIHKILQDATIKLSSVATDVFGVSGKAMIMALLEKDEPFFRMRLNP